MVARIEKRTRSRVHHRRREELQECGREAKVAEGPASIVGKPKAASAATRTGEVDRGDTDTMVWFPRVA